MRRGAWQPILTAVLQDIYVCAADMTVERLERILDRHRPKGKAMPLWVRAVVTGYAWRHVDEGAPGPMGKETKRLLFNDE